jgi:hypothetical protein
MRLRQWRRHLRLEGLESIEGTFQFVGRYTDGGARCESNYEGYCPWGDGSMGKHLMNWKLWHL